MSDGAVVVAGRIRYVQVRRGFTLVELMVVIGILLLTTYLTVALARTTVDSDRLRSSARQMQSAILGARDRAIHAGKADPNARRGLRLLLNTEDQTTVSSMVFIRSTDDWTQGAVVIGYTNLGGQIAPWPVGSSCDPDDDGNGTANLISGPPAPYASPSHPYNEGDVVALRSINPDITQWQRLYQQGLLVNGARIRIPKDTGTWYTVDTTRVAAGQEILTLTNEYRQQPQIDFTTAHSAASPSNATHNAFPNAVTYQLELAPTVLPSQEPMRLSSGIVIDLAPNNGGATVPLNLPPYSTHIDIMFTPRGMIWGPLAARGLVHFWLADLDDATKNLPLLAADPKDAMHGDRLLVTLFTQTGTIGTFDVDASDDDSDYIADDPLYFAKTGGVAGK